MSFVSKLTAASNTSTSTLAATPMTLDVETEEIAAYSGEDEWILSLQYATTENLEYGQRYTDEKYSTIDEKKNVTINSSQISLTQESNSQYIPFVMPRYFDGIDLMRIEDDKLKRKLVIYYLNTDGAEGWADPINVYYNSTQIKFGWVLNEAATALKGKLTFEIQARGRDPFGNYYILKTRPNSQLEISESLKGNGQIIYDETWVTAFLNQIDEKVKMIANNNVVSDKFNPNINYTSGDYCINNNTLYTFTSDKSAGEWDDSVVVATTIAEELNKHAEEILSITREIADLKYTEIKITSFTNSINTVEIGSVVNEVTLSWKLNKEATSLYLDNILQSTVNTSIILSDLSIKDNKIWTLRTVDERNALDTKTTSISFLNGIYYGVSEKPDVYDSDFVLGFTKVLSNSKARTFTVNAGKNEHIYYCIPSRLKECSFNVGGFDMSLTKITGETGFDFTNASGYTEKYDIYETVKTNLGSIQVIVK